MDANGNSIVRKLQIGSFRHLARAISMVENEHPLAEELLIKVEPNYAIPIIGITGPPGSGKSTLVNAIAKYYSAHTKRVAVLAVDPSSPFNYGALLGDRVRMSSNFNDPNVFIRSMASRGSLGGLAEKTIEITDLMRSSNFDLVLLETVGVGQSEVDIAGLADITLVVLVPESGDEIQHVKSGLMEIADLFVLNKADRAGADHFYNNLNKLMRQKAHKTPVLKTVADKEEGISELITLFDNVRFKNKNENSLLTEKAWRLIQQKKMKEVDKERLRLAIGKLSNQKYFNIYRYIKENY